MWTKARSRTRILRARTHRVACTGAHWHDAQILSDPLLPAAPVLVCAAVRSGLVHDRHQISAVPPSEYADRFLRFMEKALV